jgi:hypothetical protein
MSSKRWLLVSSLGLGVVVACATADEQNPDAGDGDDERAGGGAQNAGAGKAGAAGSMVSQGGKAGGTSSAGAGAGSGGKASGGTSGSAGANKGGSGGVAGVGGSGGKAGSGGGGSGGGGSSGKAGSGGTANAGTSSGGTSSNGVGCSVEAAGGVDAAAGAPSGGAGAVASLFADDFETGAAAQWTTTLGTWAVIADDSKAYEQSLQENKLQIAIANGVCAADQIIDTRVKVLGFKGQSNSYVAALFGRVVSPSTHYLLALGSDDKLVLRKRVNSTSTGATAIGSAKALVVTEGQWYDVHFEIIGTSLKGCVGDVCVTGTDSSITSGSVGVGTVNTSARFDDVRVSGP